MHAEFATSRSRSGPRYARNLHEWRQRLFTTLPQVRGLGYTVEFVRMWEFYRGYCEAGFTEGQLGDVPALLSGPRRNISPVQDIDAYLRQ
jgi:cyclopropane-fatty-acyl-phospholipid synthase